MSWFMRLRRVWGAAGGVSGDSGYGDASKGKNAANEAATKPLDSRWGFYLRYQIANGLMRLSLALMPACRVRDELRALLSAYRAGVEAAVLLHHMRQLDTFTGKASAGVLVSDLRPGASSLNP